MKKKIRRSSVQLSLLMILIALCSTLHASEKIKVSFSVFEEDEITPVIGAALVLQSDKSKFTITDIDGNAALEQVPGNGIVEISCLGLISQKVEIKNRSIIKVIMKSANVGLDEVVVVGYGTQKKVNLTGSVQAIEGSKIQDRPVTNVTQALQGQVSGVNFTAGTNGFEPGASLDFQIRGQGRAYVLIDGVEGSMDRVNPNDIESISVLKDAAASAIYGARAPYGVVLITTKSGGKDTKPKISLSANIASARMHRKPELIDSYTFAKVLNESGMNGGGLVYTNETIERIIAYQKDPTLPGTIPSPTNSSIWANNNQANANVNYIDEFYGSGLRNQENISIQGGGKSTAYFISAAHVYDDGILRHDIADNYRRYNVNTKLDIDLTKWMKFSTNTRMEKTSREYPNFDNQGSYNLLFHQIVRSFPTQPLKSPNGIYQGQSKIPWAKDAGTDLTKITTFNQRFATVITPLKGWSINLDYSIRQNSRRFTSENFTAYEDAVNGTLIPLGTTTPSYVQKSQQQSIYQTTNAYTSYNYDYKNNHFMVMAGVQYENYSSEEIAGRKDDLVTPSVPSFSTASGTIQSLSDALSHWSTAGAFFRLGYNYKEKYLFEANGRYDGTSKFARGNQWGIFPSFSGAWNIAKEDFWIDLQDQISMLKVRSSWGQLGNQNVAAYQDLPLLGINSNLGWIINGERPVYTTAPNLINTLLTWETSESLGVGLDLAALNNRLNISTDWYRRLTKNQLGPARALPGVIGSKLPNENNSEMETTGWDLNISWRDQLACGLTYNVSAILSDYQSEIKKYNNPTNILTTNYIGKKTGEIWGYETVGLIQTQEEADHITDQNTQKAIYAKWNKGDVIYKDLNGDGIVNTGKNTVEDPGDRKVIGNTTPRYQFGLNLGAEWKGFDLTLFFQGVAKRDIWLSGNMFWGFAGSWNQCSLFPEHLNYYRDSESTTYVGLGVNENAYFPRPYNTNEYRKNTQTQSRYIQNGAYLRLKNMQVGYTIPKTISKKASIERLRVYFSGENLFTITGKFPKSLDPENANLGGRGNGKSYPALEVFAFGIDLQF